MKDETRMEPAPASIPSTRNSLFEDVCGMRRFKLSPRSTACLTDAQMVAMLNPICTARRRDGLTARAFMALSGAELRNFCRRHGLRPVHVRWAQAVAEASWAMHRLRRLAAAIGGPDHIGGVQ